MSADQKPSSENQGTIFATNSTISTLIIKEISPRVKILSGKVRIFKTSPIVLFTIARTTATIIAVMYPSTCAPAVKYEAMMTAIPDTKRLIRRLIHIK